jgi:hypothetical protein
MKATLSLLVLVTLAGCATQSKYANNPQASVVGPEFLDYIAKYPPDRQTEFCRPAFVISNAPSHIDLFADVPLRQDALRIKPLLLVIPEPSEEVKAIAGKRYPEVERKGMALLLPPPYPQPRIIPLPSK